jgi:hypothetical protein
MWIVPYFISTPQQPPTSKSAPRFPITVAWIFLTNGGTAVWETEHTEAIRAEQKGVIEEVYREYCEENGLHGTPFYSEEHQTLFVEIDRVRTSIKDFYTWVDFLQEKRIPEDDIQLWRPFFWLGDSTASTDSFGWRNCAEQTHLGSFGSVSKVWDTVFSRPRTV